MNRFTQDMENPDVLIFIFSISDEHVLSLIISLLSIGINIKFICHNILKPKYALTILVVNYVFFSFLSKRFILEQEFKYHKHVKVNLFN